MSDITKTAGKLPDEVNSYEFLSEYLYQQARRGGFGQEFLQLKSALAYLNQFEHLAGLLDWIESGDRALVDYLLSDLLRLYRTNRELRPAVVILVILIFWADLTEIYGELPEWKKPDLDERFALLYDELLNIIGRSQTSINIKTEILAKLKIRFIRKGGTR